MRNLRNTLIFTIGALLILASNVMSADEGPKNIIVMISDGCGYDHIAATSIYQHGQPDGEIYHQFRIQYGMSTYMSGGSYDPDKAWGSFNHVKSGYTDSAAAATTMATGVKTYSGAIGVDSSRQSVMNATERAKELGKATGIITSVEFSHATPAGFVAHNTSRNNYEQIAREMIMDSKVDVIMGCGNPMFKDNGKPTNNTNQYVGGKAVWDG